MSNANDQAPWRVVSRKEVYRNPWTTVWEDELEHESGRPGLYGHFAPIEAVVICPQLPDGSIMLVQQWRHAWQLHSWECPCGRIEPGENPLAAARRELAEECQLHSDELISLGSWTPADARVGGRIHGFLARNAASAEDHAHQLDPSEVGLISEPVPFDLALQRVQHSLSRLVLFEAQAFLASPRA